MCDRRNCAADCFGLCWTFKLSTVREINLFIPACVSMTFLSSAFGLPLPLSDPVSPLFQCLCWLFHVLSPPPLNSPFLPPFIRGAGSGVTNYSERAEKVVWALPSGLPCCITIRQIAGTRQPLAAGTTATAPEPSQSHIDLAKFKPFSCLSG